MTFYVDLVCESDPIANGELSLSELLAAVTEGFYVDPPSFRIASAIPDLHGGIDKHPADGEEEARAVFGGLSTLDVGGCGLGPRPGIEFDAAFKGYCRHIGHVRPGTLVGCWEWLTGPEGTSSSPRFTRIVFDSVDALLRHERTHNQVLLVRVP